MDTVKAHSYVENRRRTKHRAGAIAVVLLLPLLVSIFLFGTQRVLAGYAIEAQATLCVKPGGGDGCDAAIGDALDAADDGDTIRVAAGTYVENVVISETVTLEGGWNADFTVRDPGTFTVTIRPADEIRSVVSIEDADPTVDGFIITGGRADLGGNHGGGLRLIDSEGIVRNNTIVSNTAYLLGGGVWVQRGAPTLENNRIEGNLSLGPGQDAFGGGVALENGAATLLNNAITGNVVSGTTTYGAGVAILGDESILLQENSVLSNQALAVEMGVGGGVGINGNGTFTLTANAIASNRITTTNGLALADVHAGGGGIGLRGSGQLQLAYNVIHTNSISATAANSFDHYAYGGGVYVSGGALLAMDGDRLEENRALDPDGASSLGGGIYQQDGQTLMNDLTVRDNEAVAGGGILVTNDLEMNGSTVARNRADFGGGVYVWYPNTDGSALVRSSVINSNHARRGGGLFQYAGSLTVDESAITGNVVEELEGGGMFTAYAKNTDALTVTQSTIGDNRAPIGAGIYSNVNLHLETGMVSGNVAGDFGGGLVTRRAATVVDSAIVANEATGYGAALSHTSNDAMTLQNVTISTNDAGSAGAVYFDGDAGLANVTVSDNRPAGVYRQSGEVTLVNTIVAGNEGPNCNEALTSLGYNLEDDDTCGLNPGMSDLVFADPLLQPLGDNGGAMPTHAIPLDSPAVDAGNNDDCPSTDQRGMPRVDGDFDGTITCDMGAYEALMSLTVNSTADKVDANEGDGVCETASGNAECTLRAAIQEANALGGVEAITVPAGNYTLTLANPDPVSIAAPSFDTDDFAATGDLDVRANVSIIGAGAAQTVIDAGGIDRVFEIDPGDDGIHVTLEGVTIRGGTTDGGNGGGIYNNGRLTVSDSVVTGNTASDPDDARAGGGIYTNGPMSLVNVVISENSADDGGGLLVAGGSTTTLDRVTVRDNTGTQSAGGINNNGALTIADSTFTGNTAAMFQGGAIFNNDHITMTNVTLSGNSAGDKGGAINNNTGVITATNVTIANNEAANQGGGIYNDQRMTLQNSIVAANEGENCVNNDTLVLAGHNLEDADTCGFDPARGDLVDVDPLLGPLQDNGGATDTHALRDGSPAIDAGDDTACPPTDQRGVQRPIDGDEDGSAVCDVGAIEYEPPAMRYLPIVVR